MYLDLSQFENAIHFLSPLILDNVINRRVASRMGNKYDYAAPHAAYRCRGDDNWCAITIITEKDWQNFCRVLGNPSWTREHRFATLQFRKENEEELNRLVEEWTINRTDREVMDMMQSAGIAAGVLQNGIDLLENEPQLKHRNFYRELEHPEVEHNS